MSRVKTILIAVAVFLTLALIVRQVGRAIKHTFTPRAGLAQLDRSTPEEQNGLTLVEIDPVNAEHTYSFTDRGPQDDGVSGNTATDIGLWFQIPMRLALSPGCSNAPYNGCSNQVTVIVHGSDGETFPLQWRTTNDVSRSGHNRTYLLATLPAGYPDTLRWADVTMDDHRGDTGTWRITHLPPMQHLLPASAPLQTTFHQGGIQVTAGATTGLEYGNLPTSEQTQISLRGAIVGATHPWEVGHMALTREWEPEGYVPAESGTTLETTRKGGKLTLMTWAQPITPLPSEPYLPRTNRVRLTARMQEFATYAEIVTFHNVSVVKAKNGGQFLASTSPQTVKSPSGVLVTLDDVQHRAIFDSPWGRDGYAIHLLYPQTTLIASLPRSSFWRKYKLPIQISADIPKPYISRGSSNGNNEGTYTFSVDDYQVFGSLPKIMPNFPVIIRQRVNLRSVPMTFTLPILDKKPVARL